MLRIADTRLLDEVDRCAVDRLLAADPVAGCLIATRVESAGLNHRRLGAQLWGHGNPELDGLCLSGANLVPLSSSAAALGAFAERAGVQGRRCSSIVGLERAVEPVWSALAAQWDPPREIRDNQPLLSIAAPPLIAPDRAVRRVQRSELDVLMPACVAMFAEEVGVSPIGADGGRAYRGRVADLIGAGRAFARIEDGEVVFKAELGAVSARACQIQGVWVHPQRRGEGLAAAGTAAVVAEALASVAPVVSLYVNHFNERALRAYRRVGFTRVGTFATVLF